MKRMPHATRDLWSAGWIAVAAIAGGYANAADKAATSAAIQDYARGLSAVEARNAHVKLTIGKDPTLEDQAVLFVEYPAPDGNPASRDVWCVAEQRDWTAGHAISFQIKPDHALRLSISFLDRNRVAYTSWVDLTGSEWQTVRVAFGEVRPNPYFQPPGAKTGASLDVSEVASIGFAPQDETSGRLAVGRFTLVD